MSRLLTLYPGEWRARYGDEVEALLAARPPDLHDRLDLVRGAIDARINPQGRGNKLNGSVAVPDRAIGALAISAGFLFTLWITIFVVYPGPRGVESTQLAWWHALARTSALSGSLFGAVAVGAIMLRHGHRIGDVAVLGGAALVLGLLLAQSGPFAMAMIGFGTLVLARGMSGWLGSPVVSTFFVMATFLAFAGLVALAVGGGRDLRALWLMLPYGPGWLALGLAVFRHRTPTAADPGPAVGSAD
jgi:hypothetical protein